MAKYGILGNSLNAGVRYIICIDITDECIGRIFCQLFLEFSVVFLPHLRVVALTGK